MFLFLISWVIPLNLTFAQTEGQFPQSIIASSSSDTTPHLLKLKGTQQGGIETRVSGFSLDATSAIGAQVNSQLLVLVTDSALRVSEAKARTASNQVINLPPTASQQAASAFSLANLPGGVYTLDVITQKGNAKAAYEGVLSIGNQPLTVIEETTKRVTNDYGDLILIFLPPEECPQGTTGIPPDCIPEEECPPGTTGIPPNCEPISCDVDDPPDECVPTECPDGRIMPPGEPCPDDALPCDVPDPPEGCSVPTECPDGSIIPPGEQCPEEEPPEEEPSEEEPSEEEDEVEEESDDGSSSEDEDSNVGG